MNESQNDKEGIFILLSIESLKKLKADNCHIAWWDGKESTEWSGFYDMVTESLFLPEYFGRNLDALFDCLSDLSWLEAPNIMIVIEHFEDLLSDEILDNTEISSEIILLLSDILDQYRCTPEVSTHNIKRKKIQICILSSEKAELILTSNKIPYQII